VALPASQVDLAKAKGTTFAGAPPGSGKNFAKLKGALAKRGARNPGALAAYIGRKKYGRKGFAKLAHGHANPAGEAIDLAQKPYRFRHGWILLNPGLGTGRQKIRVAENREIAREKSGGRGGSWASTVGSQGVRNNHPPAPQMSVADLVRHLGNEHSGAPMPPSLRGTSRSAKGKAALVSHHERMHQLIAAGSSQVAMGIGHSHSQATNYARTGPALEFAMTHRPVSSPLDLVIVRGEGGTAIIRHRSGGDEIGRIRREGNSWVATIGDKDSPARTHQRSALADVVGTHNKSALTNQHKPASAGAPLQPAPSQTPLMEHYNIPAIRALATPMGGSSDGPRVTSKDDSGGDDSDSGSGLGAKGKAIYERLCSRGFPKARALAFAKRAENMAGRK
jgi:hypothetical protein